MLLGKNSHNFQGDIMAQNIKEFDYNGAQGIQLLTIEDLLKACCFKN